MKNVLFTIFTIFIFLNIGFSQCLVLDYSMTIEDQTLSFPEFISQRSETEDVYKAINELLQLQSLNKKISKSKKHLFENILKSGYRAKSTYTTYTNSNTLLSVYINTGYPRYHNFNAQNGRLIDLPDLVLDIHKLYSKRHAVLIQRMEEQINKFDDDLKREKFREFALQKINDSYYPIFFFQDEALHMYTSPDNQFLARSAKLDSSDNINWTVIYHLKEIEENLNEYGRSVFTGIGNVSSYEKEMKDIVFLKGSIDRKYPITMVLNILCTGAFGGGCEIEESHYWYDKIGNELYLTGYKRDNYFHLSVFDSKTRTNKEEFIFTEKAGRYFGTWKDLRTNEELEFEAKSYYK